MNRAECRELEDIVERNLRKQKKYKDWSDRWLHTAVAMDWLSYSPVSVPYVPEGEIWVWNVEDFRIVLDEYREWRKETEFADEDKD